MKVGISILLFGVVLMFWTGASGEQNFFRKEKSCYRQPEGNFFGFMPLLSRLNGTLVRTSFIVFKPSFKTLSKLDWSSWKFPAWNETQSGLLESSSASNCFRILSLWSPAQVHLREGRRHIHQDSLCKLHIINMMNSFGYGILTDIGMFEINKISA